MSRQNLFEKQWKQPKIYLRLKIVELRENNSFDLIAGLRKNQTAIVCLLNV